MVTSFVLAAHLLICFFLIVVVLLQQGKGADAGATFGGGSETLFGASGADNILARLTRYAAAAFMCTSIFLSWHSRQSQGLDGSLFQNVQAPSPATPAAESAERAQATDKNSQQPEKQEQNTLQEASPAAKSTQPAVGNSEQIPNSENGQPQQESAPTAQP